VWPLRVDETLIGWMQEIIIWIGLLAMFAWPFLFFRHEFRTMNMQSFFNYYLVFLLMLLLFHFLIYRFRFFAWVFLAAVFASIMFSAFITLIFISEAIGDFLFLFAGVFLLILLPLLLVCIWRLRLTQQELQNMGFLKFCRLGLWVFLVPYLVITLWFFLVPYLVITFKIWGF